MNFDPSTPLGFQAVPITDGGRELNYLRDVALLQGHSNMEVDRYSRLTRIRYQQQPDGSGMLVADRYKRPDSSSSGI